MSWREAGGRFVGGTLIAFKETYHGYDIQNYLEVDPDPARTCPRRSTLASMRLRSHEIEAIRIAVRDVFGETATVRLFGSRVRDDLRGGDIDLFVEVDPGQITIANEQRLRDRIAPVVEDLRVDIVLHERDAPLTPIGRIALRDGILL